MSLRFRARLDGVHKLPHRTFGRAITAALKSATAPPARFCTQNALEDHGRAAACRKWGSEPNAATVVLKLRHGVASFGRRPNAPITSVVRYDSEISV